MGNLEVPRAENGFYHKGVMTGVLDYRYNYELQRGDIRCTGPADFSGLLAFFSAIDPDVEQIVAYINDKPIDWYDLEGDEWLNRNDPRE